MNHPSALSTITKFKGDLVVETTFTMDDMAELRTWWNRSWQKIDAMGGRRRCWGARKYRQTRGGRYQTRVFYGCCQMAAEDIVARQIRGFYADKRDRFNADLRALATA